MCVCVYVCMYVCVSLYVCEHVSVYVYAHIYACNCFCVFVCMYMCMCVNSADKEFASVSPLVWCWTVVMFQVMMGHPTPSHLVSNCNETHHCSLLFGGLSDRYHSLNRSQCAVRSIISFYLSSPVFVYGFERFLSRVCLKSFSLELCFRSSILIVHWMEEICMITHGWKRIIVWEWFENALFLSV